MTSSELEKRVKLGELQGIYLLYGENKFAIEMLLKKIKNNFGELIPGINYINIDDSSINNLLSDIATPAFGYPKKLIIVKNSGLFKKEAKTKKTKLTDLQNKVVTYIEENLAEINEMVLLIFYEEKAESNSLYQLIDKVGNVCNFENLRSTDLVKKLKSICNSYEVNVEEELLKQFVELVGNDMQENINEIRKLIEYAGKGRNNYKRSYGSFNNKEN